MAMQPEYNARQSWFPGLKILDRYIIGKFVGTYLFAIAMIIVVVVVFDYVEKIDDFTTTHAPVSAVIFDYYLKFIPFFVNQFSALFTFEVGVSDRDCGDVVGWYELPTIDVALLCGCDHHHHHLVGYESVADTYIAAGLCGI